MVLFSVQSYELFWNIACLFRKSIVKSTVLYYVVEINVSLVQQWNIVPQWKWGPPKNPRTFHHYGIREYSWHLFPCPHSKNIPGKSVTNFMTGRFFLLLSTDLKYGPIIEAESSSGKLATAKTTCKGVYQTAVGYRESNARHLRADSVEFTNLVIGLVSTKAAQSRFFSLCLPVRVRKLRKVPVRVRKLRKVPVKVMN